MAVSTAGGVPGRLSQSSTKSFQDFTGHLHQSFLSFFRFGRIFIEVIDTTSSSTQIGDELAMSSDNGLDRITTVLDASEQGGVAHHVVGQGSKRSHNSGDVKSGRVAYAIFPTRLDIT